MDEKCKNCEDQQACVPFFVHEDAMMHYNKVNKRTLITFAALFLVMCITVSFIIGVLVNNNTVREKQIIDMVNQRITEVENGVHEQPDP
jgi:hypothetical protein